MNKRTVTITDLERLHMIQDLVFSPDGKKLAFVRKKITGDDYCSHLFVQDTSSSSSVQWTFGNGTAGSPQYSPDGKWLIFSGTKSAGDKPQLFLFAVDGGEAEQLTDLPEGAYRPRWNEESSEILFSTPLVPGGDPAVFEEESKTPEPLIIDSLKYKSDAAGFFTDKRRQLAVLSLSSKKINVLTEENFDLEPADWNKKGSQILYLADKHEDSSVGTDLYLFNRKSGEHKKIMQGAFSQASFSPDDTKIAVFGHEQEFKGATQSEVWIYDVESVQAACLTEQHDLGFTDTMIGDIQSASSSSGPYWRGDGKAVYAHASYHGSTNLYEITTDGTVTPKTEGKHHVFASAVHSPTATAAAAISRPDDPGEIYISSLDAPDWKQLTSLHEIFHEEVQLFSPEEIWFKAKDGLDLQGWIIRPDDSAGQGLLEIHGGPHAMYGSTFFHEMQLLASRGYTVFYCNPRGSHGYGQQFVNAVRGDYGGMDYEDIMSFTDEVLNRFDEVDKNKLGVTGGSYGGFMTNWITAHTDRFKAAATLRCISNWISFYGVSDIGYFFTEWEVGRDFLDDPDTLWKHSPLKYVSRIKTPLLIMHGEKDLRCPIEQAEQLFVSLKKLGRSTRFIRFPEANHDLSRSGPPYLRRRRLEELTGWFDEYLR
ncbi:MAG: S9 family peptidase [Alkalicoccus sp.]|nr:MAG: S9 family peptidase [Alkalicoccus sp.]